MEEEIVRTAVELAGAYGPLAAIAAIVVGAILLVLYRRAKAAMPPASDPGPAPKMPDAVPGGDSEWGDNVTTGLPPDERPEG